MKTISHSATENAAQNPSPIPHSPFASLAPARLALRAAFGRLSGRFPPARVRIPHCEFLIPQTPQRLRASAGNPSAIRPRPQSGLAPSTPVSRPWTGFTLIELLIVIAIIGILAGLTIATVGGVQKSSARNKAKAEVEALSRAIESYKLDPDFNFTYPVATNLYNELTGQGSVNGTKVFFEPPRSMVDTNSNPRRFIDPWGNAYIYITNNPVNIGMFDIYSTAGQTNPSLYIRN